MSGSKNNHPRVVIFLASIQTNRFLKTRSEI
nr:MAG TPA: hypothetical protein [Caudoviricetes sp.]DAW68559.1 MAG TPA: hypothetical protein [Caudoviricetes sp.]